MLSWIATQTKNRLHSATAHFVLLSFEEQHLLEDSFGLNAENPVLFHMYRNQIKTTRSRRDLKALERIMREMVESGGIVNPAFRPGR
ncbi:hypothetical protein TELCIR_01457 [Teladorsagia circumcincta]|uniref:Uncharacterized protein n=1 Tax=Teladorsagia circumcincta TaxID=45464 RepID=A0A2G9V1Y0_TELCI|nr:hypothetical protein TELCIR_01457 [Teladorsagia circumcincta]